MSGHDGELEREIQFWEDEQEEANADREAALVERVAKWLGTYRLGWNPDFLPAFDSYLNECGESGAKHIMDSHRKDARALLALVRTP